MTAVPTPAEPWDGVPSNPEREGAHYVGGKCWHWNPHKDPPWRGTMGLRFYPREVIPLLYEGPIPTPAELAALRRVADAARSIMTAELSEKHFDILRPALDALPGQQVRG